MALLQTRWHKIKALFEAWVIDHEILRAFYRNLHKLSDEAYRSNHPTPRTIKSLKKKLGIKTIVNLRGQNSSSFNRNDFSGQYKLEYDACQEHGIKLITFRFSSRDLPQIEEILDFKELLDKIEYPVLLHCKSGADRAGLASTLYLHFRKHEPIENIHQLGLKFGHIKWAETGILDYFFNAYKTFHKTHPDIEFIDWVKEHYDRDALNKNFRTNALGKFIVNTILRRE